MKPVNRDIYATMRQLMKEKGFPTLQSFADATGFQISNLRHKLTGEYMPDVKSLLMMAKALRVPIDDLLNIYYGKEMNELREVL